MALETKNIAKNQLLSEVQGLKNKGYRFVTMSCVDLGDSLDLIYHFDLELQMVHLRITLLKGDTAPSISGIFFAALLIENETKDHFGANFDGLVLDFGEGKGEGDPLACEEGVRAVKKADPLPMPPDDIVFKALCEGTNPCEINLFIEPERKTTGEDEC